MSIKVAITMGDAFLLLDVTVPLLLWLLQHARSIAIRRACLLWQDAVLCFLLLHHRTCLVNRTSPSGP